MYLIEIGAYVGVATAIITQIIKLLPYFDTKEKKKWLAFGVALAITGFAVVKENLYYPSDPFEIIGVFGLGLATAYGLYKAIIEQIFE